MRKLLILIFLCGFQLAHSSNLQLDLESCYKSYLDALKSNDVEKLKASMSTHSFINMKNLVVSSKLEYPTELFSMASQKALPLKKEHFVMAQEKAVTANCIYHGKGFNYTKAILVLSFVKEGDHWKFEDVVEKSNDDIISKIENNDFTFLKTPEFTPTGAAPAAAKEIEKIEYRGTLNFHVEGYKISSFKINGVPQDISQTTTVDAIVLGGLKKGINFIEVRLVTNYHAEKTNLKINIKGIFRNGEKEVFQFHEEKPSIMFTKEFEIN